MRADAENAVTPEAPAAKPTVAPAAAPEPATFRHTWARTALREGMIFLLISGGIVLVSGFLLPISSDAYWLLLMIVGGIGAGMALLFYLVNVVPRLLIGWVVRTHAPLPELYRQKREQEAFGRGFWISWLLVISAAIVFGASGGEIFVKLLGGVVGGCLIAFFVGLFNYARLQLWHAVVRFLLRHYSLTPPIEAPDGYADTIMDPPSAEDESGPLFADTGIISSQRPERQNAAPTGIRAEEKGL
jgi:hypothetical protein